jgi:hypothetical protein
MQIYIHRFIRFILKGVVDIISFVMRFTARQAPGKYKVVDRRNKPVFYTDNYRVARDVLNQNRAGAIYNTKTGKRVSRY